MENRWNIWGISGTVMLCLVGMLCVFSVEYVKRGGPLASFPQQGELQNTIEIPLSKAKDISITYTSDNLKIYPTDGDCVIIKEYLSSRRKDALATTSIEDGRAFVTGGERLGLQFWIWSSLNERIEIYLPKEGIEKLEIVTQSGNITEIAAESAEKISVSKAIDIKAASGNLKVNSICAEAVNLETHSGNISAQNIEGKANISASSGNVTVKGISGRGSIQTHSGNVTVTDFAGQGEVQAGSGNVKVEMKEVTGNLALTTKSGNVRLVLPEELSFALEVNTGSGNIHTDFDPYLTYNKKQNHAEGTVGDTPACEISAEAGSGNVSVRK